MELNKGCVTCEDIAGAKTLEGNEGTQEQYSTYMFLYGEGGHSRAVQPQMKRPLEIP